MEPEDTFLLTGGIHEVINQNELLELLASADSNLAVAQMLELAQARGAKDYLTALVFQPTRRDAG